MCVYLCPPAASSCLVYRIQAPYYLPSTSESYVTTTRFASTIPSTYVCSVYVVVVVSINGCCIQSCVLVGEIGVTLWYFRVVCIFYRLLRYSIYTPTVLLCIFFLFASQSDFFNPSPPFLPTRSHSNSP